MKKVILEQNRQITQVKSKIYKRSLIGNWQTQNYIANSVHSDATFLWTYTQ